MVEHLCNIGNIPIVEQLFYTLPLIIFPTGNSIFNFANIPSIEHTTFTPYLRCLKSNFLF